MTESAQLIRRFRFHLQTVLVALTGSCLLASLNARARFDIIGNTFSGQPITGTTFGWPLDCRWKTGNSAALQHHKLDGIAIAINIMIAIAVVATLSVISEFVVRHRIGVRFRERAKRTGKGALGDAETDDGDAGNV